MHTVNHLWNQIFLLSLFSCSEEPLDNLKIQKIVFVSENEARKENLRAANFSFFRYNLGPYSKEIANDVRTLEDLDFIGAETRQPTDRGRYVLEYAGVAQNAAHALDILHRVCKKYRNLKSSRLVSAVYKMEVPVVGLGGQVMRVRDIPLYTDILDPDREGLQGFSPFTQELLDDLKVEFSLKPHDLDPDSPANVELTRKILDRALT